MTSVALVILLLAGLALLARAVVGPSTADRVVALDALVAVVVSGIVLGATKRRDLTALDSAVVLSLVGFIGTAVMARFIEKRGP